MEGAWTEEYLRNADDMLLNFGAPLWVISIDGREHRSSVKNRL